MESQETAVEQLDRLASRIVAREAVFFVGAGFSIDSERNTAGILVARLVARFEAITDTVAASAGSAQVFRDLCASLKAGLRKTFSVDGDIWQETKKNVNALADNYYQINDWMCSAFDLLLAEREQVTLLESLNGDINALENRYLQRYHEVDAIGHKWPLGRMDVARLRKFIEDPSARTVERAPVGKALFLETMGFTDQAVMAGNFLATPEYVSGVYLGRLRPRHYALAWMAHERVLPVVVTTNYDLLLEGAFRLAGMRPQVADEHRKNPLDKDAPMTPDICLSRRLQNFTPIADATEFFTYGDGHESALLLKIHGCVYRYRFESRTNRGWYDVLPTMVFTFREVQNWREDSWSRDFLQTLMRTHTIAFTGYSTADPVIHDSFRSVYEEMARYRARRYREVLASEAVAAQVSEEDATAFYYGVATKREFHALEILRASSLAVGARRAALTSHPNLIGFHFEPGPQFPTLDEVMLWTYHLAYRRLQMQALTTDLCRVYYQLFGRACPEAEADAIIKAFGKVVEGEFIRAAALEDKERTLEKDKDPDARKTTAARRAELHRTVGWTAHFHRNLMREYAAADLLVREPRRASRVHAAMRWPWYAALSDHPDWGAWAVVLELALRRRSAAWVDEPCTWEDSAAWIEPIPADRAAVLLPARRTDRLAAAPAPRACLSIEVPELRMMTSSRESARTLHLLPRTALSLRAQSVPWRRQVEEGESTPLAPAPGDLWVWAFGHGGHGAPSDKPSVFFGGTDVRPFERNAGRNR